MAAKRAPVNSRAASTKRRSSAGSSSSAVSPRTASSRRALVVSRGWGSVMKKLRGLTDGALGRAYLDHPICESQWSVAVRNQDHDPGIGSIPGASQAEQVCDQGVCDLGVQMFSRFID